MTEQRRNALHSIPPQQAVQEYLDGLLLDATEAARRLDETASSKKPSAPMAGGRTTRGAQAGGNAEAEWGSPECTKARPSASTKPAVAAPWVGLDHTAPVTSLSVSRPVVPTQLAPAPVRPAFIPPVVVPAVTPPVSVAPVTALPKAPVVEAVVETTVETMVEPVATRVNLVEQPWRDGRPSWAQERFECLLFRVAGLTLAVPLVELGGVLRLDRPLKPLFGQPEWFLGLLPYKTGCTVRTIDTARWVMPEKYTPQAGEGLRYVILMGDSGWGLGCHVVADAITLRPEEVRWRTDRGVRPWLAGTVIEHMCAIMDVGAMVKLLTEKSQALVPGVE